MSAKDPSPDTQKLLTLTDVSRRTGIPLTTLRRVRKEYGERIPSVGEGRRQRYPEESLAVFRLLQEERGKARRRRGGARGPGSGAEPGRRRTPEGLLTLTEIEERTGISYPTLLRYVRLHLDRIPHVGSGRARRYKPSAVEVFRRLRAESPRDRRRAPGNGKGSREERLEKKVKELEKAHAALERKVRALERALDKPLHVTITR